MLSVELSTISRERILLTLISSMCGRESGSMNSDTSRGVKHRGLRLKTVSSMWTTMIDECGG
jgi:hypothetical protein